MTLIIELEKKLEAEKNPKKAEELSRFFKTGKGEYGEGDRFLGITVPLLRKFSREYKNLEYSEIERLISSPFHEKRVLAVFILVLRFQKGKEEEKQRVFELYKKNLKYINNWDLVDESAPKIIGEWFYTRDRKQLFVWVKSKSLWERRISILASFYFLRKGEFADTFAFAEILLGDKEDLIHKAVGWMVREVYKRNPKIALDWIESHALVMPRTMLRYAIEKVPEKKRLSILNMGKKKTKKENLDSFQ